MRIKTIEIENFRQYEHLEINFDKKTSDLHVLIAKNGVGKSNFLNAITWCLYKEEDHLQDKTRALPIVNTGVIKNTEIDGTIEMSVTMVIDIDGKNNIIKRTAKFIKLADKAVPIKETDNAVSVTFKSYDQAFGYEIPMTLESERADAKINTIFTKKIRNYFFFDNEQMENYFSPEVNTDIREAIFDISKINLLKKVIDHMNALYNDYGRSLSRNTPDLSILQDNYDEKVRIYKDSLFKNDRNIKDRDDAKKEIAFLDQQLQGQPDLVTLEAEINKKQAELKSKEKAKNEAKIDFNRFVFKYTYLLNFYPALKKAEQYINRKEKEGQLPPAIDYDLLNKLLADKSSVCPVCSRNIGDDERKMIKIRLEAGENASKNGKILMHHRSKITEMILEVNNFEKEKEKVWKNYQNIVDDIGNLDDEIYNLKQQEKKVSDKETVLRNLEKREDLQKRLEERLIVNCTLSGVELKKATDAMALAKDILDQKTAKCKSQDRLYQIQQFVNKALSIAKQTDEDIVNEIRKEISDKTFEQFDSLIWKEKTYKGVSITENYTVNLLHVDGYDCIGATSAAERSLLALSFTNAMHEVSGFKAPLVIDSPVGRVSDENRGNLAKVLAELSKEKQIIMFFTPDEYSSDVSDVFDKEATKYQLTMDSETENISNIRKVSD